MLTSGVMLLTVFLVVEWRWVELPILPSKSLELFVLYNTN